MDNDYRQPIGMVYMVRLMVQENVQLRMYIIHG